MEGKHRHFFLFFAICSNLSLLIYFKYFNFFNTSLRDLFSALGLSYPVESSFNILLPLGISFYVFQAISYNFDVYQKTHKPEKHFGYFALYLAFFPKLIAGPIERAGNLLPQIRHNCHFSVENAASGLNLIMWGVFKKIVVADRLAMYVDMVFKHPQDFTGTTLILATWLFTLQIYCDFSGYTDMALGCGKFFGINLTQNFNYPYMATSIAGFWHRWHISLTSWFRDYLYIPLGGNRVTYSRWCINIFMVFILSGLWHGANWTFICWGGLHGILYLTEHLSKTVRTQFWSLLHLDGSTIQKIIQTVITFNLVALAWVFFRADNLSDAIYIFSHMFVQLDVPVRTMSSTFATFLIACIFVSYVILEILLFVGNSKRPYFFKNFPFIVKFPIYIIGLLTISLLGVSSNEFIYFHF
jgi:D-alanyl-lipoteichoic acid acyltransferase DltB (MBOAT superfamily)